MPSALFWGVNRQPWQPCNGPQLAGFGLGVGLFFLLILCSEPGFVPVLDHANLLFHEAGHPVVGLFSRRLEPYGGTVGQLVFPVVLAVHFWRKGQPLSLAVAGLWLFENWLNIARYVADARALELPLVGGGDHDWNTILSRWGMLQFDVTLATMLRVNAWLGMIGVCLWLLWRPWLRSAGLHRFAGALSQRGGRGLPRHAGLRNECGSNSLG